MLLSRKHRHSSSHSHGTPTRGRVLDRGWRYDLEVWFFDTFVAGGEISRLRRRVIDAADLGPGRRLLDVGCGTGTLALQAAPLLGAAGMVAGVDPAARQIDRARAKARRAGLDVDFRIGVIEDLPFDDGSFDRVTSTLMMHHLPDDLRRAGLAQISRVLAPGGRLVVADFDSVGGAHDPAGVGHGGTEALAELIRGSGFEDLEVERITFSRAHRGWSGASVLTARSR